MARGARSVNSRGGIAHAAPPLFYARARESRHRSRSRGGVYKLLTARRRIAHVHVTVDLGAWRGILWVLRAWLMPIVPEAPAILPDVTHQHARGVSQSWVHRSRAIVRHSRLSCVPLAGQCRPPSSCPPLRHGALRSPVRPRRSSRAEDEKISRRWGERWPVNCAGEMESASTSALIWAMGCQQLVLAGITKGDHPG